MNLNYKKLFFLTPFYILSFGFILGLTIFIIGNIIQQHFELENFLFNNTFISILFFIFIIVISIFLTISSFSNRFIPIINIKGLFFVLSLAIIFYCIFLLILAIIGPMIQTLYKSDNFDNLGRFLNDTIIPFLSLISLVLLMLISFFVARKSVESNLVRKILKYNASFYFYSICALPIAIPLGFLIFLILLAGASGEGALIFPIILLVIIGIVDLIFAIILLVIRIRRDKKSESENV